MSFCKICIILLWRQLIQEGNMATNIRMKVARVEKDWTQQELADRVGVTRQTIIALEANRYVPSLALPRQPWSRHALVAGSRRQARVGDPEAPLRDSRIDPGRARRTRPLSSTRGSRAGRPSPERSAGSGFGLRGLSKQERGPLR